MTVKSCETCGNVDFIHARGDCKACHNRKYYQENKKRLKKYYRNKKEHIREVRRKHRKKNRKKINAYHRAWYAKRIKGEAVKHDWEKHI